jgi:ribulose-phosphate 3-epimerase
MDKIPIISPSILAADFGHLANAVQEVEAVGAQWIHIDVMDGHFVPNITMGPFIVKAVRGLTQLPLDVHLMITNPERYLEEFAAAGATNLTVQIETCPHIHRTIQQIHQLGCKAGIAINPGTPPVTLQEVIDQIDLVLVMTVNPGFSGQKFIEDSPDKIARVNQLIAERRSQAVIEVDGGISPETLPRTYHAGARIFVSGSSIFEHPQGPQAGYLDLQNSIPIQV